MSESIRAVGYGSLMSARGLGRNLPGLLDAWPVHLDTRRAFAKPPQRGGYLAMDIALDGPIVTGRSSDPGQPPLGGCEGLLLRVALSESPALARREGYTEGCWQRLLDAAGDASLGEFLLELAEGAGSVLAYRKALHAVAGPSSLPASHYLPHPVRLDDGLPAVVFVAPAVGATGIPGVDSAKAAFPGLSPRTLADVYELPAGVYPPFDPALQTRYVELCLLAAAHGLWVADLLPPGGLDPLHPVAALLRRWREDPTPLHEERDALRSALPGLTPSDCARRFARDLEAALERSGLAPYFA